MRRSTCSLTSKTESFFGFSRYKQDLQKSSSPQTAQQMLLTLTPAQREVVVLYLLDRLSVEEIACELCIPKKTVYTRIYHARKKLKENAIYFFDRCLDKNVKTSFL